jgi:hypothetical protein
VIPENSLIFQVYAHQSGKPVATLSDREKINQFTGLLSSINDNWVKPGDAFPSAHTTILIYRKDRKKGDIFWLGDGWIGVPGNTGPQLTYLENDSYQKIRTMLNITAAR